MKKGIFDIVSSDLCLILSNLRAVQSASQSPGVSKEILRLFLYQVSGALSFSLSGLRTAKRATFWAIGKNSKTSDLREWESYYGVSTHAPAGVNGQYVQRVRQWDKCGERRLSSARLSHQHFYHYQPTLRGIPNAVDWNLINDTVKTDFCQLNHNVPDC